MVAGANVQSKSQIIIWHVQLVLQLEVGILNLTAFTLMGMAMHKHFKNWKAERINIKIFLIFLVIFMGVSLTSSEHRGFAVSCIF